MEPLPDALTLARFSLAQQHPVTAGWADDQVRLAGLAAEHEDDLMLATDLEVATIRRDRFAPDRPIEVMLNRWLPATPDLMVMLSMRYEGGDPSLPFVDASVLSRAVTIDDLEPLTEAARRTFGDLRPLYLRIWSAEPHDHFPGADGDKRFLAAPLDRLRDAEVAEGLRLEPTTSLEHYAEAEAAYAAVDARFPCHPRQAAIAGREQLQELLEAGLLFDVIADDAWIGYAAVKANGLLGLPGYTVSELVLTEAGRGRGRGRSLSTLLARALPGDDLVLIGTIHADNVGSRRGALAAGRIDIGGWFDVPLR
ncbi:hypothetical protein [Microlunatus parietis]|uniref:hypothetical protein n=1 Tax=Microlunatus parietis TaxID=682979 RepID=UPI001FEA8107|nr:hypothetical protein [Microlunatus parietis]